jgi:hypothetical protein
MGKPDGPLVRRGDGATLTKIRCANRDCPRRSKNRPGFLSNAAVVGGLRFCSRLCEWPKVEPVADNEPEPTEDELAAL